MSEEFDSDLSAEATDSFLKARNEHVALAVRGMESVETWTKDRYEDVQATLQLFADKIEDCESQFSEELQQKMIVVLGYISSGKTLKFLMSIDGRMPNFVARMVADAQMMSATDTVDPDAARLFVERFHVLDKLHILSQVYAPERLEIVQKVLRILADEDEDDGE